ncbi:MAG: glycosyltransferase family 4 protein, partial [Parvularculaceae bacterium]
MKSDTPDSGRRPATFAGSAAKTAIIGTFPPRRCGLATFTQDLLAAIRAADERARITVCAIRPSGYAEPFGDDVSVEIDQASSGSYVQAAAKLNARGVSVVSLQHEFGIFGGEAGNYILRFLDRLDAAVVTTLHTIAPGLDGERRRVLGRVIARSAKVVVMAEKGREILIRHFDADPAKIEVIPHGAPARERPNVVIAKQKLGLDGRPILMTFGLLGRGKGLETMIRAVPTIAEKHPSVLYIVLGATHPNVIAAEGEAYRNSLIDLAGKLGVADNVRFIDKFVPLAELIDHLSAADIYVTPYLNEAQITSGTLAHAYALGKPIVSTPYWHAAELLSGGRGALCDFNDSGVFARSITYLLDNPDMMEAMGAAAYESAQSMRWPTVGRRYLDVIAAARVAMTITSKVITMPNARVPIRTRPSLAYLERMTDHVGLLQHAVIDVPNRQEGYCIDDNARALMLMTQFSEQGLADESCIRLESIYAAFVQSAWNPEIGRFRNFMSYGGEWLEEQGSEDSQGRTLVALSLARVFGSTPDRRIWADNLFHEASPAAGAFAAPRARAQALNALVFYDQNAPGRRGMRRRIERLANELQPRLPETASP